jgi:hypothetical protein
MVDFYGLNRDDWLSLVVKVSPNQGRKGMKLMCTVLLCTHGEGGVRSGIGDP